MLIPHFASAFGGLRTPDPYRGALILDALEEFRPQTP